METMKDFEMVRRMFEQGQLTLVDPESKYRYSLTAFCPKDREPAFVERYEKAGRSLSRVVFHCGACGSDFETGMENIRVI
jgi:hypothetical protein